MKSTKTIIILLLCFLHNTLSAQVKIHYGFLIGLGQNEKRSQHQHTTPEMRNAHVVNLTEGFLSPVIGINSRICYGNLYSSVGFEFNKTGTYVFNFESREYYKWDGNGNLKLNTYNDNSSYYLRLTKLNLPVELGFQVMKNYAISPFIFSGANINYIVDGKLYFIDNRQDVYSEAITTTAKQVRIFDRHDDYYNTGRRLNAQFIIGGGLKIKQHLSLKASMRSKNYVGVSEQTYLFNSNSDRSSAFHFTYKEYILACTYHF